MNLVKRPTVNSRSGDLLNKMNVTLMMILLAFFIVLNTMSVPSPEKREIALGSLVGSRGLLPGGFSFINTAQKDLSKVAPPIKPQGVPVAKLVSDFEQHIMENDLGKKVSTEINTNGIALTLESSVIFVQGTAEIKPSAVRILHMIEGILVKVRGHVVVETRSDVKKIKSPIFTNATELSIGRSGAIARFFEDSGSLKDIDLAIAGYGPLKPLYPNDPKKNKKKNDIVRFVQMRAA